MSERTTRIPFRVTGATNVGQRSINEDFFLLNEDIGLMMVADGVGGHQAGEVASALTCKVLESEVAQGASLVQGIKAANLEVFDAVAQERGRPGMATTLVAVLFDGPVWSLAWVGDSRAYLWDGQLALLSRDHSLVENLVQSGQISLEEARSHPKRNVIDQAIGLQGEDNLRIGSNSGELMPGQVLLLCSDGLNDVLDNARIAEILASSDSLESRCRKLVMAAVADGGRDNTTVVLLEALPELIASENPQVPDFVWRYDPVSKHYAGLPELQLPAVGGGGNSTRVPEGTILLKAPVAPDVASVGGPAHKGGREGNRRTIWIVAAIFGLAVLAWQSLR